MGARYFFNETSNQFDFEFGEPLNKKVVTNELLETPKIPVGIPKIPVEYPEHVVLVEGTHPEVFSANGSHGTWASNGE